MPRRDGFRQSGINILCHAVDLNQPPDRLIAQMGSLAELVAVMAGHSMTALP